MLNSSVVELVDLNPEKFELWLHNLPVLSCQCV